MLATYAANRSSWLFFVHVGAAFLFFGGALTVAIASIGAARARGVRETALLARLASRVNLLVVWPALVILVGAGAQLASSEDAYGRGWLRYGIVLTAIAAFLGGGVAAWLNRGRLRHAERLVASGEDASARPSPSPILALSVTLTLAALVVVLWLMTAKPGIV